jgi:HSP20 family molecular chaperone IbpA
LSESKKEEEVLMIKHTISAILISLAIACSVAVPQVPAAQEQDQQKWGQQFVDKMKQWQDRMSDVFRDTFRDLRAGPGKEGQTGKSVYTATVDVREQPDRYTVRLHLPAEENARVTLESGTLKITTGAVGYEQSIMLPEAAETGIPEIERKNDVLVVTVPKGTKTIQATPPDAGSPAIDQSEQDMLTRMERMQRQMDRIFDEAFENFRLTPPTRGFFDQATFGSALDLQEEKDAYIVRAYLPEREISDVRVSVEGNVLKIEAREERKKQTQSKTGLLENYTMSGYSQALTLPGPVKSNDVKVERKEEMIVITLPKA